ncbi:MAG: hypothetical protein QOI59_1819 [Gammaproteobacteria bacterium]|nr:hypothetical protein [Gammaproteobacteria bacterium]
MRPAKNAKLTRTTGFLKAPEPVPLTAPGPKAGVPTITSLVPASVLQEQRVVLLRNYLHPLKVTARSGALHRTTASTRSSPTTAPYVATAGKYMRAGAGALNYRSWSDLPAGHGAVPIPFQSLETVRFTPRTVRLPVVCIRGHPAQLLLSVARKSSLLRLGNPHRRHTGGPGLGVRACIHRALVAIARDGAGDIRSLRFAKGVVDGS